MRKGARFALSVMLDTPRCSECAAGSVSEWTYRFAYLCFAKPDPQFLSRSFWRGVSPGSGRDQTLGWRRQSVVREDWKAGVTFRFATWQYIRFPEMGFRGSGVQISASRPS